MSIGAPKRGAKPDELALWGRVVAGERPRDVGRDLGIPSGRVEYLCEKWASAGHVADGVRWPDGSTSIRWRGENPSVVFWDSHESVEKIHGHNGATRIVWDVPLVIPPDLASVQRRLEDVIQGEIEHWDQGPLMEAAWASLRDIQPLMTELAASRPSGGWQMRSVGFLLDGEICGDDLHRWRIKLGERTEACAYRLTTERRAGGWPTIAGAPNGLPLFVRRTDETCDCARLGVPSPETGV